MTTITSPRTRPLTPGTLSLIGTGTAVVACAWTVYGAHDWTEIAIVFTAIAVVSLATYGYLVPRALRRDPGATAVALGLAALVLLLPAFWSGLPLVLGVAAMLLGRAGRTDGTRSGRSIAAIVLGAVAVVGYLAIYIWDGPIAGNAGFLFD